jgi:bacillolysin
MRTLFFVTALLLFISPASAQKSRKDNLGVVASFKNTAGWYLFDKGYSIDRANLDKQLHSAGVLPAELELQQKKHELDELGMAHTWFEQLYKGYLVEHADIVLHEKPGMAPLLVGELAFTASENPAVSISFETALATAKNNFPIKKYAWENPAEEKALALRTRGIQKTFFPTKLLVWMPETKQANTTYILCYKLSIASYNLEITRDMYIDAFSGRLIKSLNTTCNYDVPFNSVFNGPQTAVTTFVSNGNPAGFQMIAPNNFGNSIYTSNNGNLFSPITDADNTWDNSTLYNSAFSSQWATLKCLEYYKTIHNRTGFDGTGNLLIDQRQNAGFVIAANQTSYANASFSASGVMKIGNNESAGPLGSNVFAEDDWNSFDIICHEVTHGVTGNSAALVYEKEPGALNESFSDIFGATGYAWFKGLFYTSTVWLCGYDRKFANMPTVSAYLRNMTNPNNRSQPDIYSSIDSFWVDVTTATDPGDNWGVHTNSGVQNFMYYLLVSGGSGTNKNNTSFTVSGIGIVKARAIAYRALTAGYLTQTSGFRQSRAAWIRSAEDLYGVCSIESKATANAWKAVGVEFNSFNDPINFCGTYGNSMFNIANPGAIFAANACSTTVNPSFNTSLVSGTVIFMYPGFTATAGSNYLATIDAGCAVTDY